MSTEVAPTDGIRDLLRTRIPRARDFDDLPDDLPLGEGGLGLDSIALVELLLECEQRFCLAPPLTLLDGPPLTVGLLAEAVLRLGRVFGHEPDSAEFRQAAGTTLVPLRRGDRPAIFLVPAPPAMGLALLAHARLARRVKTGRLFLAFHPGENAPAVGDIVETALQVIQEAQPHGPYALVGECAGGILAWEVARRLAAGGERVDLLALLDTPWRPFWRRRFRIQFPWPLTPWGAPWGGYLQRRTARHLHALRSLRVTQWPAYVWEKASIALAVLRLGRRPEVREALRHREWYAREIWAISLKPWSGHVCFVQSGDSRHRRDPVGWATLARSIEVVHVPGNHITFLSDHMDDVAAALSRWLSAP